MPPRQSVPLPVGEHVEEVTLTAVDPAHDHTDGRREAYQEDNSDEEEPGIRNVQCAHQ